jgi:phosphomannomutase
MTDARTAAQAWLAVDPDPETRAALTELLDGPPAELQQCFGGRLTFGTAGLRGQLGPGPLAMNRVIVRMAAAALGRTLLRDGTAGRGAVVGFDARHKSDVFASDTARVLAALGIEAWLLDTRSPTPILAFAVRHLGCAAGVMVTASHNPPADNGYKVYWGDGAQIVPPVDRTIEAEIEAGGLIGDDALAP